MMVICGPYSDEFALFFLKLVKNNHLNNYSCVLMSVILQNPELRSIMLQGAYGIAFKTLFLRNSAFLFYIHTIN